MWLYVSSFCNIKFLHYKYEISNPESEILTNMSIKENGFTRLCVCVWIPIWSRHSLNQIVPTHTHTQME
jgi:hypothetical protein